MKTQWKIGISVLAAVAIMSGCSSSDDGTGTKATTGDDGMPSWTKSKETMTLDSAAKTLSALMSADEEIMLEEKSSSRVYTPSMFEVIASAKEKVTASSRADRHNVSTRSAPPPSGLAVGINSCSESGTVTVTRDSNDNEDSSYHNDSELFDNCVDDGSILRDSNCIIGGSMDLNYDLVKVNGECKENENSQDGEWHHSEEYIGYSETWTRGEDTNNVVIDVVYTMNESETWTENPDKSEDGHFLSVSDGYMNITFNETIDNTVYRYEMKQYTGDEVYHYDSVKGDNPMTTTTNGYFGSSLLGTIEGVEVNMGTGYYYKDLIGVDRYVDANTTSFHVSGTFGALCAGGIVEITTPELLMDSENTISCDETKGEGMPKSGQVQMVGDGVATARFFEAVVDSNNSDVKIVVGADSHIYDCIKDIPHCDNILLQQDR